MEIADHHEIEKNSAAKNVKRLEAHDRKQGKAKPKVCAFNKCSDFLALFVDHIRGHVLALGLGRHLDLDQYPNQDQDLIPTRDQGKQNKSNTKCEQNQSYLIEKKTF